MKFEYIKFKPNDDIYEPTDIIKLNNGIHTTNYLLIKHINGSHGALNLQNGTLEYLMSDNKDFRNVVSTILYENKWDMWSLIKSEDIKIVMNCKKQSCYLNK